MTDRKKRMALGAAAIGTAAAGIACTHAATAYFVNLAMDREAPKFRNTDRLKGRPQTDGPIPGQTKQMDASVPENCESVEIQSCDGEKLVGHWYPAEHPQRTVLAFHGWRSSWEKDFGALTPFLHAENCNILFVEQRGQNNSGGAYISFGLMERYDCMEWIKWVHAEKDTGLPLYLAGVSMGATTVLMASGLKLPENVRGIIADCGFTSPHQIWKHVTEDNLRVPGGFRARTADRICQRKIHMSITESSTVEAMKENQTPILFIHGTDDHFVPIEMTYEAYKACSAPKRLFVVPGAGHCQSYAVDTLGYQMALRTFWSDFDR